MHLNKMDCHALTRRGQGRSENEDQYLIADLVKAVQIQSTSLSYDAHANITGQSHGKVLLVAEGRGGQAAGRRASTLAVDETINSMVNRILWSAFDHSAGRDDRQRLTADLVTTLKSCQNRIHDELQWNDDKQGMATTLTVAIVDWPALYVGHVGNSRCYLDRAGRFRQLTASHGNVIGGESADFSPQVYQEELAIGDTLLLCTDALTKHVADDEIAEIIHKRNSAKRTCEDLVAGADAAGSSDNITVAVARFHDSAHSDLQTKADVELERDVAEQKPRAQSPNEESLGATAVAPPVSYLPR